MFLCRITLKEYKRSLKLKFKRLNAILQAVNISPETAPAIMQKSRPSSTGRKAAFFLVIFPMLYRKSPGLLESCKSRKLPESRKVGKVEKVAKVEKVFYSESEVGESSESRESPESMAYLLRMSSVL